MKTILFIFNTYGEDIIPKTNKQNKKKITGRIKLNTVKQSKFSWPQSKYVYA